MAQYGGVKIYDFPAGDIVTLGCSVTGLLTLPTPFIDAWTGVFALGTVLYNARKPPQPMVTVSLTTDFIESACPGDWVEAHVDVLRIGKRLAYANCYLHVGERRILRASAVFAVVPEVKPKEESEG